MSRLNDLSPEALKAAMEGGSDAWGQWGSAVDHKRYAQPIKDRRRARKCHCGCEKRSTHLGKANGVCLMSGCELQVRRWVRDPQSVYARRAQEPRE